MPLYRITAPNGQTYQIEGPEGASDADVARAVLSQHPDAGTPAPETTVGGNIKEAVKGVIPGAIGLLESAATGASALLPEETEKAAREKIASVAGAAKAPFAPGRGYEQSVGRRIGEGLGSMLPIAPLGLLGVPGAIGGVGVGLAAGAGEARTRAEQEGATAEQRSKATAAGTIPGAFDTAIDMALAALPGGIGKSLSVVRRALVSGGVEGATEAAQAIAQNAIAKGLYKPDQALLESAGEEGAYGAGVGMIASVLMDMALPGRTRGAHPQMKPVTQPGAQPQAPAELPPGQAEMFTPAEMGVGKAPAAAPGVPAPQAPAGVPEGQMDLGLDFQREVEQLYLERERLKQAEQTEETKARIADLSEQISSYEEMNIAERRAQAEADAERVREEKLAAEKFPALANAPELMAQPDEVKARTQGELFPGEDLGVAPTAEPTTEPTLRRAKETGPRQLPLGLRRNPEGQPTTFGQPEPTITSEDVLMTAIPVRKGMEGWIEKNIIGSTRTQLLDLVQRQPELIQGSDQRAKLLRALTAAEVPAFKEAPRVKTRPETPAVEQRAEPGAGEPSVGVPVEPAAPVQPKPRARVARPAAKPATPDGLGLVPAGQPAGTGAEAQAKQPAPVTDLTQERAGRKALDQEGEAAFAKLRSLVDQGLASDADIVEAQNIIQSAGSQREAGFKLFKFLRQVEGGKRPPAAPQADMFAQLIREPSGAPTEETTTTTASAEKPASAFDWKNWKREIEPEGKTAEDIAAIKAAAARSAKNRHAAATDTGQTLADLTAEIESAPGKLGEAARRMLKSGKLRLEERSPTGKDAGLFDGTTATLYAAGINKGRALDLLLHEVGAHMGLQKMLGQKQYDAIVDRILNWMEKADGSLEAALAQSAFKRIPIRDLKRGSEVARDEMVAYFVEEVSRAEARGDLPKTGPIRALWNQIKNSIVTAVNKALGTSFGVNDITPEQILRMVEAAVVRESKTGVETAGETKQLFAVAPGTEALVDSMGPLDPEQKSGLSRLITGFKDQTADLPYAVKFRTQAADAAATVEHRLREQFDGAVRDSLGKLNPMGLYRQAQDHAKLLLEYFQVGGLAKDKTTGLWVVQSKEGVRPPSDVYAKIDAWGAKNGYDRQRATQIASRVLEGVRLNELLKSNKDFPSHMQPNEIAQLVAEYNADPDLQEMSKLMDEARIAMVDNMVAAGRLSKEQGAEWKQVVGYVPFDRIEDFATNYSKVKKISNKGIAQIGKLPELIGSEKRPVGNVFDNYLNTLGWMVGQTMKTDATVQTLRSLEKAGFAKFLHGSTQGKANTVGMYVGGEMKYWELPSKYDVLAFKDLNPPKATWLRMLGQFSNVLRTSVTALPPFALKQVTDDVQRAIMTSGVRNPGALLRMSLSNFGGIAFAELRGIQHPSVKEFGRLGLTGEYDFQAGKPATSLLKDLGYKKRGKVETLLHRLEGVTRASDLAVRKAIYDQTLKETNDQLLAQTRAREFINFRRRGASDFVGAMVTTIPFFNAYIQGMDVLYRAASGKDSSSSVGRAQARRMFWSRAATVMVLSSLYALGKGDDEDYADMDMRTRDNNWILGGGYKIPVPGELGALFKVIPERVVEYMRRQGTPEEQTAWEATRTALSYIFEQYAGRVVPVPQAVKPLLEAFTNHSFFTGRELEGIYQKQQDPSMRRASNTSELAIAIAAFSRDVIGVDKVSPILVDNALSGYFGSSAALLTATTDSLLNPTRVDRPLHKWALVSNYMYDPVGTRRMTEFYESREEVGRANATLNELAKTDIDRAAKYAEEHADELALESAVNSTLEQLERTRAYRKYLNSPDAAKEMPKEERESELQELRKLEVGLTGWLREAKASIRSSKP